MFAGTDSGFRLRTQKELACRCLTLGVGTYVSVCVCVLHTRFGLESDKILWNLHNIGDVERSRYVVDQVYDVFIDVACTWMGIFDDLKNFTYGCCNCEIRMMKFSSGCQIDIAGWLQRFDANSCG